MLRQTTYKSIAAGAITLALAMGPGGVTARPPRPCARGLSDRRSADAIDSDLRSAAAPRRPSRTRGFGWDDAAIGGIGRSSAPRSPSGGGAVVVDVAPARAPREPPCRADPELYHPGTRAEEWVPG